MINNKWERDVDRKSYVQFHKLTKNNETHQNMELDMNNDLVDRCMHIEYTHEHTIVYIYTNVYTIDQTNITNR